MVPANTIFRIYTLYHNFYIVLLWLDNSQHHRNIGASGINLIMADC